MVVVTVDQDNFKDSVQRWVKVTDALWRVVAENPSIAPAIYSWTIAKQGGEISGPERKNPLKSGTRMGRELKRFWERYSGFWSRWPKEKCDVLFVPNSSRSNYLGACMLVAESLFEQAPWIKTGFIIPADWVPENSTDSPHDQFCFYRFKKGYLFSIPLLLRSFQLFGQIKSLVRHDKQLFNWFAKESFLRRWRKILSSLFTVHFSRKWLKRAGCSLVITPNEQWMPGSTLVAAASLEGIYTCQILHGLPFRYYWPFLSEEFWLWGPVTERALQEYGAPPNRLKTLGSLEFAGSPKQAWKHRSGLKTCLFLSQWHGRENLGVAAYLEILNWIGTAIADYDRDWRLVIRWHPHDGEDGLEVHKRLFLEYGVNVSYSEKGKSLEEDVMVADFVCTQSSTAILMSLKLGVPCTLLWAREHFRILGEPFLGPPFLSTGSNELKKAMSGEIQEEVYRKSTLDLLGDPEITTRNTSRRITEILSHQ